MANSIALVLRQPLCWLPLVVGGVLIVTAGKLAGHQQMAIGATAERLYLRDGFYPVEIGSLGKFRWTQPSAQIALPHVGPGPITVRLTVFDVAPAPRDL